MHMFQKNMLGLYNKYIYLSYKLYEYKHRLVNIFKIYTICVCIYIYIINIHTYIMQTKTFLYAINRTTCNISDTIDRV